MTADSLKKLEQFNLYCNGYTALRHWITARTLVELDFRQHLDGVIEGYEMACELFLKHIIKRTSFLSQEHIQSHNVWALACDADIHGRDKYRILLKKLGNYYRDCRYESDDMETHQSIRDYFEDEDVYELADQLLFELYTLAKDTDRTATAHEKMQGKTSGVSKMNLFGS